MYFCISFVEDSSWALCACVLSGCDRDTWLPLPLDAYLLLPVSIIRFRLRLLSKNVMKQSSSVAVSPGRLHGKTRLLYVFLFIFCRFSAALFVIWSSASGCGKKVGVKGAISTLGWSQAGRWMDGGERGSFIVWWRPWEWGERYSFRMRLWICKKHDLVSSVTIVIVISLLYIWDVMHCYCRLRYCSVHICNANVATRALSVKYKRQSMGVALISLQGKSIYALQKIGRDKCCYIRYEMESNDVCCILQRQPSSEKYTIWVQLRKMLDGWIVFYFILRNSPQYVWHCCHSNNQNVKTVIT